MAIIQALRVGPQGPQGPQGEPGIQGVDTLQSIVAAASAAQSATIATAASTAASTSSNNAAISEANALASSTSAAASATNALSSSILSATSAAASANSAVVSFNFSNSISATKDILFQDRGNSGTVTQTFNYALARNPKITATGAFSIAVTNWPTSGILGWMILELVNGGSTIITWPSINWIKSDGSTTTNFANNGVTLQTTGTDWILLWSRDNANTIYGKVVR